MRKEKYFNEQKHAYCYARALTKDTAIKFVMVGFSENGWTVSWIYK